MTYNLNSSIRILVVGDIMLDHYIYGVCNRISPEAPVQVVEIKKDGYTLGGAGNVLKNLKALYCDTNIVSVTGDDEFANIIIERLLAEGFSNESVLKDNTRCTTVKSRVMVSNHQLIRLDREDTKAVDNVITEKLLTFIEQEINSLDIVLISDYNKGLLSESFLSSLFGLCKKANVKTIIDPKGTDYAKYSGGDMIKPNKKEAQQATGIEIKDMDSLTAACSKIKEITGCSEIVVTMSEEGIAMYTNDRLTIIPTKAMGVNDVTGAGDTVLASLGVAIASGYSLTDACHFANLAAAVVVSKVGSATATLMEINQRASVAFN